MNSMTAIGPGATVNVPGDFVVTIRRDGELLTIGEDGGACWVGEMSLKQVAAGAAKTLTDELWKPYVPEEARAVVLTRLYDRMDHESRVASFDGRDASGAVRALQCFAHGASDEERAISLLNAFDGMTDEDRRLTFESLLLVGLDVSRKLA